MSKQLAFCIEQNMCTGCKACQVACKDKHDLEVGQLWRRVEEMSGGKYAKKGSGFKPGIYAFWTSISCNHCEKPVCVEACPKDAIYKREEDGIVVINKEECIGCRSCEQACPYGAPQFNPEEKKMGKCDFCIDLIEQGKDPECVAACPMRAIHYGELKDLKNKYKGTNKTEGLPEPKTKPALIIVPHKDA